VVAASFSAVLAASFSAVLAASFSALLAASFSASFACSGGQFLNRIVSKFFQQIFHYFCSPTYRSITVW
jgi:hypothetical protein